MQDKKRQVHHLVGAQRKERKQRICLRCDQPFSSRSRANRICSKCKRQAGDITLPTMYHSEVAEPRDE